MLFPIYKRIRELRKNLGLTQSEFAEKIGVDSKMISYYENGKSLPSVDALVKIAELFDVSIDYLLLENAPKRSLKQMGDVELMEQISELDKLTEEDRESIKHIIKSLITKNKVKDLMASAS